ncbi:DNA cytosine methyltransferase [Solilutibacter silvestris]|uniref:DNA cytosine methyltransferase n=1 Tax=Solilutibacter silvestris TaxID=1645665 RepID=UPI003D3581BD
MAKHEISAVDLFCGAGGLTYGLAKSGIRVAAGVDVDKHCEYPYEQNNNAKFIKKDVAEITAEELSGWFVPGTIRLLAGCAPCQPFSAHTKGKDTSQDPKWPLLDEFSRLVREIKPELVTMENVSRIQSHSIFQRFVTSLENLGYHVAWESLYCPKFGIPQERRRLVLMASLLGPITTPKPTHPAGKYPSVRSAIGRLPKVRSGEYLQDDPLHLAREVSDINLERLKNSKPGGTWLDWPKSLRSPCHIKSSGRSFKNVYSRMEWDHPAPTITTQFFNFGTGRFGHPVQNRAITLREGAILQSFPAKYRFTQPRQLPKMSHIGRLIGNAVPPRLAEVVGRTFVAHVKEHR